MAAPAPLVPEIQWAQTTGSLLLKIEIRALASDISDYAVEWSLRQLSITYRVAGQPYALHQTLAHAVVPEQCTHALTGRVVTVELAKARSGGWRLPFKLAAKPRWLKAWHDRGDDINTFLTDSDEGEAVKPGAGGHGGDLRAALRQVDEDERRAREQRQRELEAALKRGERPAPREEVPDTVALDQVD